MKKTHTVRTFLAGVLAALLLVGMVPPALAAAGMNITIYPGISVYMDDQKLEPKDANGNHVYQSPSAKTTRSSNTPVKSTSKGNGWIPSVPPESAPAGTGASGWGASPAASPPAG